MSGSETLAFLFTGHFRDKETGLYLAPFRNYSTSLARWSQRDPAGFVDGPNLYGYVSGNPVRWFDPLGLDGCCHLADGSPVPCDYDPCDPKFTPGDGNWILDCIACCLNEAPTPDPLRYAEICSANCYAKADSSGCAVGSGKGGMNIGDLLAMLSTLFILSFMGRRRGTTGRCVLREEEVEE